MAKLRIKKRKTDHFNRFALIFFIFAICCHIGFSLTLNVWNTRELMNIQDMQSEINRLKEENEKITIEISGLENKDRIYEIASTDGLEQNQDNVISITNID